MAQNECLPSGDVNGNTQLTPGDASLALRYFLNVLSLDTCAQARANVDPSSAAITPADVTCIFRRYLRMSSCLDILQASTGGDQFVLLDRTTGLFPPVMLNGSNSRALNDAPLTFQWAFEPPAGSDAVLAEATTPLPGFTPDVVGLYRLTLTIRDTQGNTAQDTVTVNAQNPSVLIPQPCFCAGEEGETISLVAQLLGAELPSDATRSAVPFGLPATSAPAIPHWPVTVTLLRGDGFFADTPACMVLGSRATGGATVLSCLTDAEGFVTSLLVLGAEAEHIVRMQALGVEAPIFFCTNITDRDGDCLPDALEVLLGLDADRVDTDGNGVPDGQEDFDGEGLSNLGERVLGTDPTLPDTNEDGIRDGEEDTDNDALADGTELRLGTNPFVTDSDGDGWNDEAEVTLGSNPLDRTSRPRLFTFGAVTPVIALLAVGTPESVSLGVTAGRVSAAVMLPGRSTPQGLPVGMTVGVPPVAVRYESSP